MADPGTAAPKAAPAAKKAPAKKAAPAAKKAAAPAKKAAVKKTAAAVATKTPAGRVAAGAGRAVPAGRAPAKRAPARPAPQKKTTGKVAAGAPGLGHSVGSKVAGAVPGPKGLVAEYVACTAVLLLGTLVAPAGSKDGIPRAIVKFSGLSLVFFILGLMSAGGKGAQKAAAAFGLLLTVTFLFTSSDAHNLAAWMTSFFGAPASDTTAAGGGTSGGGDQTGSGGTNTLGPGPAAGTDGTDASGGLLDQIPGAVTSDPFAGNGPTATAPPGMEVE